MDVCTSENFVQGYILFFVAIMIVTVLWLIIDGGRLRERGHSPFAILIMVAIGCLGLIWAFASSITPVMTSAECSIIIGG